MVLDLFKPKTNDDFPNFFLHLPYSVAEDDLRGVSRRVPLQDHSTEELHNRALLMVLHRPSTAHQTSQSPQGRIADPLGVLSDFTPGDCIQRSFSKVDIILHPF